jgi:hypothetical protein
MFYKVYGNSLQSSKEAFHNLVAPLSGVGNPNLAIPLSLTLFNPKLSLPARYRDSLRI